MAYGLQKKRAPETKAKDVGLDKAGTAASGPQTYDGRSNLRDSSYEYQESPDGVARVIEH